MEIIMAKLKDYYGKYCESEYEYALFAFLEKEGWLYALGTQIGRETKRDVLKRRTLRDSNLKGRNEKSFLPFSIRF